MKVIARFLASISYCTRSQIARFPPKSPSPPHTTWYLPPWWRYPGDGSVYKWGCFNLNAHLFDTLYFVQSNVIIITISVFAISKGNPLFVTPKTLQCVLQSKTLVLLGARKTKLVLKFWMDCIAKKARKETTPILTESSSLNLCIIVMFNQLFGLSFWRHPFTAEHPLVSKWWNADFLQINKLISTLDGLSKFSAYFNFWVNYSLMYFKISFLEVSKIKRNKFSHVCPNLRLVIPFGTTCF